MNGVCICLKGIYKLSVHYSVRLLAICLPLDLLCSLHCRSDVDGSEKQRFVFLYKLN